MAANPKWLKDLDSNVAAAVKELANLRRQNKSLKTQLDKAKAATSAAEKKAKAAAATAAEPDPQIEAWKTERKEVRRRVVRLAKKLEELA